MLRVWPSILIVVAACVPPSPEREVFSQATCPDGRPWQGRPCTPGPRLAPIQPAPVAPPALAHPLPAAVQPTAVPAPAPPAPRKITRVPLEEGDELACKEDDTIACLRIHCASGSPAACWMGGYALTQGRDAPWEGLPWLESACDLGF